MECASCTVDVEEGTIKCPSCGYYPQKRIVATGVAYMVLGLVIQFSPFGFVLLLPSLGFVPSLGFIPNDIVTWSFLLVFFLGIFLMFYGASLAVQEQTATVNADLGHYVLPIFL